MDRSIQRRRRVTFGLSFGLAMAIPMSASAGPPRARGGDDRPFGAGTLVPSFGFGASINSRVSQVAFGAGARYFALPGLGVGLSFSNAFTIYGDGFANGYPGIRSRSPTWEGDLVPNVLVVPYRSRWFSPYVLGGIGPRFLNNGKPTLAVWQAGAGAFIGLGGPVFLDLGVGFQQAFPRDRCDRAYTFATTGSPSEVVTLGGACLVTISPRIGLAIGLGVGRSRRERARGGGRRGSPDERGGDPWGEPAPGFTPPPATPAPEDATERVQPPASGEAPAMTEPPPSAPIEQEGGDAGGPAAVDPESSVDPRPDAAGTKPSPSAPMDEVPSADVVGDPEVAPAPSTPTSSGP